MLKGYFHYITATLPAGCKGRRGGRASTAHSVNLLRSSEYVCLVVLGTTIEVNGESYTCVATSLFNAAARQGGGNVM